MFSSRVSKASFVAVIIVIGLSLALALTLRSRTSTDDDVYVAGHYVGETALCVCYDGTTAFALSDGNFSQTIDYETLLALNDLNGAPCYCTKRLSNNKTRKLNSSNALTPAFDKVTRNSNCLSNGIVSYCGHADTLVKVSGGNRQTFNFTQLALEDGLIKQDKHRHLASVGYGYIYIDTSVQAGTHTYSITLTARAQATIQEYMEFFPSINNPSSCAINTTDAATDQVLVTAVKGQSCIVYFYSEMYGSFRTNVADMQMKHHIGSDSLGADMLWATNCNTDVVLERVADGCAGQVGDTVFGSGLTVGCPDYDPIDICTYTAPFFNCPIRPGGTSIGGALSYQHESAC